jgi:hypothetical protein
MKVSIIRGLSPRHSPCSLSSLLLPSSIQSILSKTAFPDWNVKNLTMNLVYFGLSSLRSFDGSLHLRSALPLRSLSRGLAVLANFLHATTTATAMVRSATLSFCSLTSSP